MNKIVYLSSVFVIVLVLFLGLSQQAYAQCIVIGPNPGGGEIVECNEADNDGVITTNNSDMVTVQPGSDITSDLADGTIQTLGDDDNVQINGGSISNTAVLGPGHEDGVNLGAGDDVLNMIAGTITASEDCLEGDFGNDTITVSGGMLHCVDDGICGAEGDDVITVTGGVIIGDEDGIDAEPGNDIVSVSNATVETRGTIDADTAIETDSGDDTVMLGTGANILGLIDGGADIDTLIFQMAVPNRQVSLICSQLQTADPAAGSIVINGLFYEWEDFEFIECNISGGFASPVPTLSEWGLISMASILGIIGFIVARRRKVIA